MEGKEKRAGSTILEVVVGLAVFVLISAVFFQMIINTNRITGRIISRNQEMQELQSLYYAGNVLEKTRIGEEDGIFFFSEESSEDGFAFLDSALFRCKKRGGNEVLYVLERESYRAPLAATRSQAK